MSLPNLQSATWFLIACSAKTTVILGMAWIVARISRGRPAAFRHAIWAAALISVLALPVLSTVIPAWHSNALRDAVVVWAPGNGLRASGGADTVPAMVVNAVLSGPSGEKWGTYLLLAWAVGFAVLAIRMAAGLAGLRRAWSESHALADARAESMAGEICARLGIRRRVRLRESQRADAMPVTWGLLRPTVLLPGNAVNWTERRLRNVLTHELAHVARYDWLTQMAAELATAVHWFHPFAWVAVREMRRESERTCDDSVLNSGVEPAEYARQILEFIATPETSRTRWSSALAMARPTSLERRFAAMLHPTMKRGSLSRIAKIFVCALAVLVLMPLAAVRLPAQDANKFGGTISDPSGLPIANATISMISKRTHEIQMTTSDGEGKYVFVSVAGGDYELRVQKRGFAETRAMLSTFGAGRESLKNDITLDVGSANDEINVIEPGGPQGGVSGGVAGGVSGATGNSVGQGVSGGVSGGVANGSAKTIRIRIGGDVEAAKAIEKVPPVYPEKAKAAGVQGTVILHAVIGIDGTPQSLKVMNNQIDSDLARAAVEAVSKWRYQTTLLNGEPIEVDTTIQVNFTLAK
ncbi:MAG TPA: M56 family metallopeptidase [Candidatus Acidoferrum sp.]|nr:M56 family metallopeptidase [Candidatus Acidoferrum sp.]